MSDAEPQAAHRSSTLLLVADWTWCLFDEDLQGRELDFPALGWRRIWLEEGAPEGGREIREWYFGCEHPDAASLPAPAWRTPSTPPPEPQRLGPASPAFL